MNKIHGEHTRPTNEPPLCHTCSAATVVRGTRFGDDVLRCHVLGRVTFHVTECNAYTDARLVPVYRLEETAWRWIDDRFVSPAELMRLQGVSAAPTSVAQGAPNQQMQRADVQTTGTVDAGSLSPKGVD